MLVEMNKERNTETEIERKKSIDRKKKRGRRRKRKDKTEREGKKEIFALLGVYAALFGNCLSTFRASLSVPYSWAA
jgi:hypothetical protein